MRIVLLENKKYTTTIREAVVSEWTARGVCMYITGGGRE
jgi:hypothetical protein